VPALRPVPTITAIGVASPSASGKAMTKTVIVTVIAKRSGWPSQQNQTSNVATPIVIAAKTNYCDALSASSCGQTGRSSVPAGLGGGRGCFPRLAATISKMENTTLCCP